MTNIKKLTNMNYRNSIFKFMGIAAMALAVTSCTVDEAQDVPLVKLGAAEEEFVVEADASTIEIEIYANSAYRVERINESEDWLNLTCGEISEGKSMITAEATFNDGFKRSAGLVLCSELDGRRDTLYIKQKALIEAKLQFADASLNVAGAGGETVAPITSNIPFEDVTVEIAYADEAEAGWIESINIEDLEGEDRQMTIVTTSNPSDQAPRVAAVEMSFTDGWGDSQRVEFNLLQRTSKETFGSVITMEQFRQNYTLGKVIDDYVLLQGVVTSNVAGLNAGEPEQKTSSSIDYTFAERTVYMQTEDGRYGIALLCKTAEDNIFEQWDRVELLIHGATGKLLENPDRFELHGVTKTMITSRVAGQKVPEKLRSISELTDQDIYTYVTLKDVQFPVRKGSLCPVNEGYTIGTGAHRLAKYPLLVVDAQGNQIRNITNANCTYRSQGRVLPYGTGKMSGVVVHEHFSRFDWRNGADLAEIEDDPTLGDIGRYSIRHQSTDDIWGQMPLSVEDGKIALLCEYRYWNPDKTAEVLRPTYGNNGWLTHTYQPKYCNDAPKDYYKNATYGQYFYGAGTYDYLGPVGNGADKHYGANYGNMNGCGIIIDPAKESWNSLHNDWISHNPDGTKEWCGPYAANTTYVGCGTGGHPDKGQPFGPGYTTGASIATNSNQINYSGSTSMRGKGNTSGNCWISWASHYWWDDTTNRPYGWLINVNTTSINASQNPTMQISCLNAQQSWYSPRYWKAEWSLNDSQQPENDANWNLIEEYTIPDVSVWANTLFSSIVAFKTMSFKLPAEICGHENVYIRLVPTSDLCSSGADYADARLSESAAGAAEAREHASALSYFAIRYTK